MTVTIVGAGLAGLSAALTLARSGVACTLVSAQHSERAQSVMAEGGINAALNLHGEDDDPSQHAADTLRSAAGLASPNAVRGLCEAAPEIVRDLISLGVPFQVEHGHMVQRYFGGQKKRRTAYAKSSTGKALVSAMIDAVRRYEALGLVSRLAHHSLVSLNINAGRCLGAWVRDDYLGELSYLPGQVILATGGYGGLLGPVTTGTTTNTGDVTALCLAQGVQMANLEFLQYHPTTAAIPGKRMLVSEAARGEGGRLCVRRNGTLWYFMEERYPELGNLMPRDVVSREEAAVLADPACGGQVYLDMRALSRAVWRNRLSDLREECMHYLGVDPAKELLPVEPGLHYSMGGIKVDEGHRTNIAGLYAAGECACQYHGANRLGGNSLLGALYGGRVAAASSMGERVGTIADTGGNPPFDLESPGVSLPHEMEREQAIQQVLVSSMGIIRNDTGLAAGLSGLDSIDVKDASARLRNRWLLARAAILSARARTESRGAHCRSDFPERDEAYSKLTVAALCGDELVISFEDVSLWEGDHA